MNKISSIFFLIKTTGIVKKSEENWEFAVDLPFHHKNKFIMERIMIDEVGKKEKKKNKVKEGKIYDCDE